MEAIKAFEYGTPEFRKLEAAAKVINSFSKSEYIIKVGETYFDFGQDWKWTTLIADNGNGGVLGSYQLLNPKQQEKIVYGTLDEFQQTVAELINYLDNRA